MFQVRYHPYLIPLSGCDSFGEAGGQDGWVGGWGGGGGGGGGGGRGAISL